MYLNPNALSDAEIAPRFWQCYQLDPDLLAFCNPKALQNLNLDIFFCPSRIMPLLTISNPIWWACHRHTRKALQNLNLDTFSAQAASSHF